jgi:serpin B
LNGSDEATKKELLSVMHLKNISQDKINEYFKLVNRYFHYYKYTNYYSFLKSNPFVNVAIANSLWIAQNYKVKDKAEKDLQSNFEMQSYLLNTVMEINDWVKTNTKGKITKIIDSLSPNLKMGT